MIDLYQIHKWHPVFIPGLEKMGNILLAGKTLILK